MSKRARHIDITNSKQNKTDRGENPGPVGDNTVTSHTGEASLSLFERLEKLDKALTDKLAVCASRDSAYGYLRPLMQLLEYSCHGIPWLTLTIVAILMSHQIHIHQKQMNLFLGLWLDLLVVTIWKMVFRRGRPRHNQDDMFGTVSVDRYSFPSGHATRASMLACLLMVHFSLGMPANCLYLVWMMSVAVSRIILGRHHVSDVVCGLLIGLGTYYILVNWLWLSVETCEAIILPIQEELHL